MFEDCLRQTEDGMKFFGPTKPTKANEQGPYLLLLQGCIEIIQPEISRQQSYLLTMKNR